MINLFADPEFIERTTGTLVDIYVVEYNYVKMCRRGDDPEVIIRFIAYLRYVC